MPDPIPSARPPAFAPKLAGLSDFLTAHAVLIAAREGFFAAVRKHMLPEARTDARDLNDPLWDSPHRTIGPDEWVTNPSRGYLTIREGHGRCFRISVLQMGRTLRVGARIPKTVALMQATVTARLNSTFPGSSPVQLFLTNGDVLFDWSFDVPDLYESALSMETAIYLIGNLYETALQATLGPREGGAYRD